MNAEQEIRLIIGDLVVTKVTMAHKNAELAKKLAEAEAKLAEKEAKPEE